ncbi:MAG: hypothetical protein LBD09_06285, partial [Treponema sp.]|nr:hypothetical protein [Treponema sp.]
GIVDVNLFAGYSLILGHQDRSLPGVTHNPVIGASITIKWIGLEYGYYVPTRFSNHRALHHVALVFHFKDWEIGN